MSQIIAAITTPYGMGAVSMIRVSGAGCWEHLAEAFLRNTPPQARMATLTKIRSADGEVIDEVLLTRFEGPASYTGEDTVEIVGHGGVLITQRVLERILECGVRLAKEGEFSERAFLNGKLDLTQAEAVMDLISANSDLAIRSAQSQLAGSLGEEIYDLRAQLISIMAEVEAYIDFPEEDIDPETGDAFLSRISSVEDVISGLLETAEQGRMLREGIRTVIVGAPNAGKSSLLNQLLGFDRAIVSETAGTPRDTVEELLHIRGVPVRLIDTAGIREGVDEIEKQGIERSQIQLAAADLVIEVVDGTLSATKGVTEGKRHIRVINKTDLALHSSWLEKDGVHLSCETGEGIEQLTDLLQQAVAGTAVGSSRSIVAINQRHRDCLHRASEGLKSAKYQLSGGGGPEFAAVDLREALEAVGDVTGRVDTEEILGEIFGKFCIGK